MNFKTLQYWHKLEHFYPYNLETHNNNNITSRLISKNEEFIGFGNENFNKGKITRYYEVYFGIFKVDTALNIISQKLQNKEKFSEKNDDESCFCTFRVSSQGVFDTSSFKISSFPWAVHRVKDNKIEIDEWDENFFEYTKEIFSFIDNASNNKKLDYEMLCNIRDEITKSINWEIEFSNSWLRIDRVLGEDNNNGKSPNQIQEINYAVDELIKKNYLLNSFYARDLEHVIKSINGEKYGQALIDFINHKSTQCVNIESDKEKLFEVFNPKNMPYGKWPSGYSLRSMQQVAVNISMNKSSFAQNIFSVNGPPGTGKTALLKDIISANIVERANVLCEFHDLDKIFTEELAIIGNSSFSQKICKLDDKLLNYGIFVVSNNNSAVQNITKELPDKNSIHSDYQKECYYYFNDVSDSVLGKENGTWGMCAAVLGNKNNCTKFSDKFWPLIKREDRVQGEVNLNGYLTDLHPKIIDELGKQKKKDKCNANWKEVRDKFELAKKNVEEAYKEMHTCYVNLIEISELSSQIVEEKQKIAKETEKLDIVIELLRKLEITKNEYITRLKEIDDELIKYKKRKEETKDKLFGFSIQYFLFPKKQIIKNYKEIEEKELNLLSEKNLIEDNSIINNKKIEVETANKIEVNAKIDIINENIEVIKSKIAILDKQNNSVAEQYDIILPDEEFLSHLTNKEDKENHKQAHMKAPWNGKKINKLREILFLEAMQLHKALVENSAQMRDQLDAFNKMIRNMMKPTDKEHLANALLQSFMIAVPVVSSTFASIGSFLRYIKQEEIGLLLIDEAGQALPQSAVGAIWRSKKVIVVGDPLQIDPVVTIHDRTIECLKNHFEQSDFIANKETSAQSLADESNKYIGFRSLDDTEFKVGSPLLIHGRSQEKVFDISNSIAYNDTMIYGTKSIEKPICKWIDVKGYSKQDHFIVEQIEQIIPIIKKAFNDEWELNGQDTIPSLFIVTPFRSVKAGIIKHFRQNKFLYTQLGKANDRDSSKIITKWISNNIGTVHTFQGKEAKTVILCLGVDSGDKGVGAVEWATQKPNILNVAITRSKEHLYIVGDSDKWAKKNYFSKAYEICEKIKV